LRILIVDDHEAVREGVRAILASRDDIEVCGEAVNGQEAIEKAIELRPDLIILDINMPVLGGIIAAKEIKARLPQVLILLFSMHHGKQLVREAQLLGVEGYVNKSQAAVMLLKAVDAVFNMKTFFPSPITRDKSAILDAACIEET
jgi:DNA-binding NarL/FixJ family response regulator